MTKSSAAPTGLVRAEAVLYGVLDSSEEAARADMGEAGDALAGQFGFCVVDEYFDHTCGDYAPWARRPQAQRLLRCLDHPGCNVEAVLFVNLAESIRGDDFLTAAALLTHAGVGIYIEDGPVVLRTRRLIRVARSLPEAA